MCMAERSNYTENENLHPRGGLVQRHGFSTILLNDVARMCSEESAGHLGLPVLQLSQVRLSLLKPMPNEWRRENQHLHDPMPELLA